MVAAIGEQILAPTDVSLSNWTVRPSTASTVVLATHAVGVNVDGYTLTNPWNIVRTYNLTPGRELLFACRYRLAALLLDTCSLLQPAQFFVKKRSSEKSEVLVTVSVLEAKSCGAETVPELVTSPQTTLPVDTPPLVHVQSRLSQSSGPAEAAPLTVSVRAHRWLRSLPPSLP